MSALGPVVVSAFNVANFPEGGGHFWVYMQYVLGLRQCGREVYWLERFVTNGDSKRDEAAISTFLERMAAFGMADRAILLVGPEPRLHPGARTEHRGLAAAEADAVFQRADLLLNFHYAIDPELLARFRRTALVDIDPGLLQFWISRGQLVVPRHDVYFTTGETVGTPEALFPDCGIPWMHIHPPVSLEHWPVAFDPRPRPMTTVSAWDSDDWVVDGATEYENTKRTAFLEFKELPGLTDQPLELALFLRTAEDAKEQAMMERHGWRIRPSREVAGTPERYRDYIQGSRGEFSCTKASCVRFQNAWVSDRTLCYLASGKPVVVQDTGPSRYLPNGEGMFRFSTPQQAAAAFAAINADYPHHSRAARALAEELFDARRVATRILQVSEA
jgi:hypothetical protein